MALTWKKHDPEPSVFGLVVGNPTEYVVYTLSVRSADEEDVRAGIVEAVARMCRLADANVTERTEMVLFEWDAVYSTLTVVYTNRDRSFDAREVLKVFAVAWDAETRDLDDEDESLRIWEERGKLVRAWLQEALGQPQAQASLRTLAARGVKPVFATQPDAQEFDPL